MPGARWDYALDKCVALDCGIIAYSNGSNADNTACLCQQDFVWNPIEHLCVVDCANLQDNPLGYPSNINTYECGCQVLTKWNLDARKCLYECQLIGNSTGVKVGVGLEC